MTEEWDCEAATDEESDMWTNEWGLAPTVVSATPWTSTGGLAEAVLAIPVRFEDDGSSDITASSTTPTNPDLWRCATAERDDTDPRQPKAELKRSSRGVHGTVNLVWSTAPKDGMTASEQFNLLRHARRLKRTLILDVIFALAAIPLLKLSAWCYFYLICPLVGFIGTYFYEKTALGIFAGLNCLSAAFLCLAPLNDEKVWSRLLYGPLLVWSAFLILKLAQSCMSPILFLLVREVDATELRLLSGLHNSGGLNIQ
mmetsp:Transcript_11695/g.27434  ORF Transcript_11695/g.27434 Transcript_11695/m.27434 type:complete len:256 (-) Transcript_11695:50-817(-)|eukprot:CAMPEP_0172623316 /NCGR_PEP_ID=MMETSP1068-20121228/127521_1 /TAXON_ID=35684 /ORGANISM="Pseudopedinella elastica, Strain CCMP716" /LENGTH=255 /DNA_ID=CAMNT_0013431833 /DNA_START=45 /DNA_END=812 /DNA_ORIENTATION=-